MVKDLSKIFKSGHNFEFKKIDYSSSKVREELREVNNQKKEVEKTINYSTYDLERITLNKPQAF